VNKAKNTELSTVEQQITAIEQVAADNQLTELECLPEVTQAVQLARAWSKLRKLFSGEVLAIVLELKDSPLGFRTDRPPESKEHPYSNDVIRDAALECLLRGGKWVGNEFNVIAGRCYLTKEFFERRLAELVDELRIVEGVPQQYNGGALVDMRATWIYRGHQDSIECVKGENCDNRIGVRVNKGMGVDAILGKAKRKLYARIYTRVTGSRWLDQDEPELESAERFEKEEGPEKVEQ
jgi:hypothetical protein